MSSSVVNSPLLQEIDIGGEAGFEACERQCAGWLFLQARKDRENENDEKSQLKMGNCREFLLMSFLLFRGSELRN